MDSSRGGPLTTFIMMLPLIVVPTIAMLKPVNQEGSLLSDLLSAATNATQGKSASDVPSSEMPESDPFDAMFAEDAAEFDVVTSETEHDETEAIFAEMAGDSLPQGLERSLNSAPSIPSVDLGEQPTLTPDEASSPQRLMAELSDMGATRTLWFSPTKGQFGFVAFFQAAQGMVSYRFEATAETREAAVLNVIQQAQRWKRAQGR